MTTVSKMWEMRCPTCKEDTQLDVSARVWVRLTPDGSDPDQSEDAIYEWDSMSPCFCHGCETQAIVAAFLIVNQHKGIPS